MRYDLEERCGKFGEEVIIFLKKIPKNSLNDPLIRQLIRSATSIGANYMEASQASSKRDFRNKIAICRKESNESKYWFRMMAQVNESESKKCRELWKEAHELTLIFGKIIGTCDKGSVSKI